MKTLKSKRHYLIIASIFILIFGSAFYVHSMSMITSVFNANWIALGLLSLLLITPFGSRHLSPTENEKPHYPLWHLFSITLLIQSSLIATNYGIFIINGHSQNFIPSLRDSSWQLGLFPWAWITLLAIGFACIAYRQQKDAYFSSFFSIFHTAFNNPNHLASLIVNVAIRIATFSVLGTSFLFIILLIATLYSPHVLDVITGFTMESLITVVALLMITTSRLTQQWMKKLTEGKTINANVILYFTALIFAFLLVFLSIILQGKFSAPTHIPDWVVVLQNQSPAKQWKIFLLCWWLAWAPLIATFLAKFSRGYSIRCVILANLLLPVAIACYTKVHQPVTFAILSDVPLIFKIIPLIGFAILLYIIFQRDTFCLVGQNFLPKLDEMKHRDSESYTQKLLKNTMMIAYAYLPGGIAILSIFFFLLTLVSGLASLLAVVGIAAVIFLNSKLTH